MCNENEMHAQERAQAVPGQNRPCSLHDRQQAILQERCSYKKFIESHGEPVQQPTGSTRQTIMLGSGR